MVSDRVMAVVLVFEEDVLRFVCGYAQKSGLSLEGKQPFYGELDMKCAGDLVMCLSDFN